MVKEKCVYLGVDVVICSHWRDGGKGAIDLARAVVDLSEKHKTDFRFLYPDDMSLWNKMKTIATSMYGANNIMADKDVRTEIKRLEDQGFGQLPVCMAKTPASLSTDPRLKGRPTGFDVPISLERKNTLLTGKKDEIIRLNQRFRLNLLIVYPNLICSTKRIYKHNKRKTFSKPQSFFYKKNNKKLIDLLKNENNDLEKTVIKIYPKIKKIINYIKSQKGCYLSRITGSGSACIGIFSNMKNAIYAKKLVKLKYPKYWCVVSKTI